MFEKDLDKYWKTVVNTIQDGIMIIDKSGAIISGLDAGTSFAFSVPNTFIAVDRTETIKIIASNIFFCFTILVSLSIVKLLFLTGSCILQFYLPFL